MNTQANTSTFKVSGLHCGACVNRVKAALEPFADHVRITLLPPEASLDNCRASLEELNRALANAGDYSLSAA